jgi:tryptophan synthase beta subunit
LELAFPNLSVVIADGEVDYLVGTIEDTEELIIASFKLLLDSSEKMVTQLPIAAGLTYCGYGEEHTTLKETASHVVPIQITRREENGAVWGLIGDYEICIDSEPIATR